MFNYCAQLKSVYFAGDYPKGYDETFNGCNKENITVYYVEGTKGWEKFSVEGVELKTWDGVNIP